VQVADSGVPFRMPNGPEREQRLTVVLHVLYLIFTEGYAATSGPVLFRADLSAEAIRLTRIVRRLLPGDGEVAGLLALMLLTDARRPARTGPAGELIPLDEQDRRTWDQAEIAEGVALITGALPRGDVGPYQLQAAIAAVHDEAASAEATDWPQILALYELLLRISDNPVVALNHAVAVAMTHGPGAGLERLGRLETDRRIAGDHRLEAVRAQLLEMAGQDQAARAAYQAAARRTMSLPHQRYATMPELDIWYDSMHVDNLIDYFEPADRGQVSIHIEKKRKRRIHREGRQVRRRDRPVRRPVRRPERAGPRPARQRHRRRHGGEPAGLDDRAT